LLGRLIRVGLFVFRIIIHVLLQQKLVELIRQQSSQARLHVGRQSVGGRKLGSEDGRLVMTTNFCKKDQKPHKRQQAFCCKQVIFTHQCG
jgi:hypothetical protein